MKTLLFVAPHIGYGGAEKNIIGVANYAAECGYNVYLLTEEGRENVRKIDSRIIHIKSNLNPESNLIVKYFHAIGDIKKAIKISNADVVVSFIELWRSASVLATRFTKTKCIVSERADPYHRSGKYTKLIYFLFSLADGYVFQTAQAKDFFPDRVKEKAIVIPNPVFLEDTFAEYSGPKKNIIVSLARLDIDQKRQDLIIEAFNIIRDEFPDYCLYFYGDGKDKKAIEKLISDYDLQDRVKLMGVTENVYQSLGEARIMVLASDYEGIPNAIIESMCIGVPVVSTKCSPGGAELLIENYTNGLLVEKGDILGIANGIRYLIQNPSQYETIKRNGFLIKNKFSSDVILPKWLDYCERISNR